MVAKIMPCRNDTHPQQEQPTASTHTGTAQQHVQRQLCWNAFQANAPAVVMKHTLMAATASDRLSRNGGAAGKRRRDVVIAHPRHHTPEASMEDRQNTQRCKHTNPIAAYACLSLLKQLNCGDG